MGGDGLVFNEFGSGGGPIGNASLSLIAFLPSAPTLKASNSATGLGSALDLVLGTWRELQEWIGCIDRVGLF